ncbi:unnamed protein product [Gongylonema pulchrum]|uniref:Uncharacterized protein n=1 Tax=Gongylonema pulchrum TaxID=637853 RepID=A0A183DH80_9BILA|nr:unnamed protein product [Gongylonema pulchrum]
MITEDGHAATSRSLLERSTAAATEYGSNGYVVNYQSYNTKITRYSYILTKYNQENCRLSLLFVLQDIGLKVLRSLTA